MGDLTLHTTPYGRPALRLLRERIVAAKADDPLQPVTVVVPSNYVGVATRRMLARGELGPITSGGVGIAGLNLLTVYRLAELLGAPRLAAGGRLPVSTAVIAAAVRRVLADDPGIFAPVRQHPSTEEALVESYRELSELRPGSLDTLAATGLRAADVVRVRRAVRAQLEATWYEEADLMGAAGHAIADGSSVIDDLGTVMVYLPQDLSWPAAALLRRVAARATVEVIAARTGAVPADADVDRSLNRLGASPASPSKVTGPPVTAIVSVSDAEEEARSAVQRVLAAARDGVALERAAILYPAHAPYARIVAEQLDAAGIAWNGRGMRPLADRMLGRWLLDLLALPDARYARPAVMGLLAGAPVLGSDGRRVTTGPWERVTREAGIVRGCGAWQRKLTRYAEELRSRADIEASVDEPRDWLIARHRRSAEQADALRAFIGELFDRLAEAEGRTTWSGLAAWCRQTLRRYLGGDRARERWPDAERTAADRVEEALDRLAGLDQVEPATDLEVFRRTLELELGGDLGRVGEFGRGVLVGLPSAALGVDLDLVVVLGLAEGVFPTRPREDSLLPDVERQAVGDELRPRTERVAMEHRHLLAALAASGGQRVLTYPRGDLRRSITHAPSRWLLDAADDLGGGGGGGGRGQPALPHRADWLEEIGSFAQRMRTVAFPATRQEYGLRALDGVRGRTKLLDHPLVGADAALRRGAELALTRGRDGFSRFDGNLRAVAGQIASPAGADKVMSASRLEAWLSCPHAYFMQYVLRVEPVDNPEELLEIDAMEKGSLIHDVLYRWLSAELQAAVPKPDEPWSATARLRLRQLGQEALQDAEQRGVTGHALLWQRDRKRILADLDRFADADDHRRHELRLTPLAAERAFGMDGAEPFAIDLGDGRSVRVRGRIDRLDQAEDGTVVVTDYKTGGTSAFTKINKQPFGEGTKLQLAIYGLAMLAALPATPGVRSEYWFISTRGDFARIGYALTSDIEDELRRALRIVVDGIAVGVFPMKPPEPGWKLFTECRFCDPDDLGTADRYRDWERIRAAEALRDYVEYIAPDSVGPDSAGPDSVAPDSVAPDSVAPDLGADPVHQ